MGDEQSATLLGIAADAAGALRQGRKEGLEALTRLYAARRIALERDLECAPQIDAMISQHYGLTTSAEEIGYRLIDHFLPDAASCPVEIRNPIVLRHLALRDAYERKDAERFSALKRELHEGYRTMKAFDVGDILCAEFGQKQYYGVLEELESMRD